MHTALGVCGRLQLPRNDKQWKRGGSWQDLVLKFAVQPTDEVADEDRPIACDKTEVRQIVGLGNMTKSRRSQALYRPRPRRLIGQQLRMPRQRGQPRAACQRRSAPRPSSPPTQTRLFQSIDVPDVGMVQRGQDSGFTLEAWELIRVFRARLR